MQNRRVLMIEMDKMATRKLDDLSYAREMKRNALPLQKEVIWHFIYLRGKLSENSVKFQKKAPGYNDVRVQLLDDIIGLWVKSGLPVLSRIRVETKLKEMLQKWKLASKRAKKSKGDLTNCSWLNQLFDICKCKCKYEKVQVHQGKVLCSYSFENRVPAVEIDFLMDQRGEREMMLGWSKDINFTNKAIEKKRREGKEPDTRPFSTSGTNSKAVVATYVTTTKLRKRNIAEVGESENASDAENASGCEARDPTFSLKPVTGGKKYVKVKTSKVSAESCILADRRLASIRQQSDQLLSVAGSAIAASPSTLFREREKIRMTALKNSEALLNGCDFLQLCYDGRVVNKSDRYVFLGQFLQADCKKESVIAVKSFLSGTSVTSEVLLNTITTEVYWLKYIP